MKKVKSAFVGDIENSIPEIYLTIDHLKSGDYKFHIVERQKVIKTISVKKK
ncbi:hypothetical protein ATE92_2424 [Ulvibacter sp. MAR_2010_11]|uniref:hypothetical protein n=1 Tax=Ulvibacter sp. MAR_2010_11 TaxID=1250229 RepID=UPI000CC41E9D|nr:hypothetical protein [Ulvibacter sp. MAR_2010_11]PKA84244.1 hypothetical protein ATE92_2424 [Ulvibacter sp. MAR_2010_11]